MFSIVEKRRAVENVCEVVKLAHILLRSRTSESDGARVRIPVKSKCEFQFFFNSKLISFEIHDICKQLESSRLVGYVACIKIIFLMCVYWEVWWRFSSQWSRNASILQHKHKLQYWFETWIKRNFLFIIHWDILGKEFN